MILMTHEAILYWVPITNYMHIGFYSDPVHRGRSSETCSGHACASETCSGHACAS